jgi:hypothetical protein
VKYAFVEKNRRQYGVPALCDALQVSRSGYYSARHRGLITNGKPGPSPGVTLPSTTPLPCDVRLDHQDRFRLPAPPTVPPVQNCATCRVAARRMVFIWRFAWAAAWPRAEPSTAFAPLSHMLRNGFFLTQGFFI